MLYDTLEHTGILGMKWGFRKGKNSIKNQKSAKLTGTSKNKVATPKKTTKKMTDTEMKEAIARMELEKRYSDLVSAKNQAAASKGKAFVMSVLESSGKNIATQAATYALGSAVNKALGAEVVNPKKGQKDK